MRKTRLFVYKKPELNNPNFNHVLTTNSTYYDDYWVFPTNTQFTQYGLLPYPDNVNGDYAVRQNFGIENTCTAKFAITIDGDVNTFTGTCNISLGNTSIVIDPSYFSPVQFPQTLIYDFTVTAQSVDFGWDLAIQGSGDVIPATPMANWGIKKIELLSIETENYKEVDLYDDIEVPVTYNVADVRDISKKDSNFSLSFELPNTQNNSQLFDCIHEITRYGSSFEMLKQYSAFVELENNRTFEGYLRLTKVIIDDNREISYECNLYSNFTEFVKRLGTTTLRGNDNQLDDLSFAEYSVTLTTGVLYDKTDMFIWDTSTNPWTVVGEKDYGKDFYCAIVDRWNFNQSKYEKRPFGENPPYNTLLCYPLYYDQLTPFLFYKEIWDKIFVWAGFSYVSDFLENTPKNPTTFDFTKLAYPNLQAESIMEETYTKVIQDDAHLITPNSIVQCYWHQNTSLPYPLDECTGYVDCYSNPNNELRIDEVGMNVSSFSTFYHTTINKGGVYNLDVNIPFDVWIMLTDQGGANDLTNTTSTVEVDDTVQYTVRLELVLRRGGSDSMVAKKEIIQNYESTYDVIGGCCRIIDDVFTESKQLYLEAGDELFIKYYYIFPQGGQQGIFGNYVWVAHLPDHGGIDGLRVGMRNYIQFLKTEQETTQLSLTLVNDFEVGSIYNPTVILDAKETKIQFVKNVISKFNLYIEDVTNKKDANGNYYRDYPTLYPSVYTNVRQGEPILRIEPRDIYYNTLTVKDMTDKVDVSSVEFERIDEYLYKMIDLNDENDKTFCTEDYANYLYIEGEYGEKKHQSPYNTDTEETCEIKTKIGQTMVDRYRGECEYLQCPKIFTFEDVVNGTIKEDKHYNSRMLFVNNINVNDWINIGSENEMIGLYLRQNDVRYNGVDWVEPVYTLEPFASYILLDHFNKPYNQADADLNFGMANWHYNNTNPTTNTAYKVFYRDMIESYNDADSRLMKCKMYLKPSDIRDLKLSDTIIINSVPYHINKINQWKNGDEKVEVELIKIITSNSSIPIIPIKSTPPKNNPVPSVMIADEVKGLAEIVENNKEELAKNVKLLAQIEQTLKNLDERVKKLENS